MPFTDDACGRRPVRGRPSPSPPTSNSPTLVDTLAVRTLLVRSRRLGHTCSLFITPVAASRGMDRPDWPREVAPRHDARTSVFARSSLGARVARRGGSTCGKAEAVVYVTDLERMRSFYERCIGLERTGGGDGYAVLESEIWRLSLVLAADSIAATIQLSAPARRRATTAIKLAFAVARMGDSDRRRRRWEVGSIGPAPSGTSWDSGDATPPIPTATSSSCWNRSRRRRPRLEARNRGRANARRTRSG